MRAVSGGAGQDAPARSMQVLGDLADGYRNRGEVEWFEVMPGLRPMIGTDETRWYAHPLSPACSRGDDCVVGGVLPGFKQGGRRLPDHMPGGPVENRSSRAGRRWFASGLLFLCLMVSGPLLAKPAPEGADRLLNEARTLLQQGRTDKALTILRRPVLKDNALAYYWQGVALNQQKQEERAIAALREAIRLVPGLVDAHLLLGDIEQRLGRLDQAIAEFEIAERLAVDSPFESSIRDRLQGLYKARMPEYMNALPGHPELAAPAVELAKKMFRLGLYSDVERLLEGVVEQTQQNAQAYYWLGQVYLRRRRQNEGLRSLERSVELAPDNPLLRLQLGKAYEDQGRFDRAEGVYRKILANPSLSADLRAETQRRLDVVEARRRAISGDTEQALARYLRLLKQRPDDVGLLELAGLAFERLGRRQDADRMFKRLRELLPDDATLRLKLAEIYRLRGDLVAMQETLKEALGLARDEDVRRQVIDAMGLKRGDELILAGEIDQARRVFESLQTLVPDYPGVLMRLARIAMDQKRYGAAEGYLERVLARQGDRLDARLRLGQVYMQTGRTNKAIATLEAVARAGATHEEARAAVPLLKTLYVQKVASMTKRLRSADRVDAKLRKGVIDLGRRLYGRGQLKEAESLFKTLLSRLEGDAQADYWLGQIELRTGHPDQGLASLARSVERAPGNARLLMELAKAYEGQGRWADAERTYGQVIEAHPPSSMRQLAEKRRRIVRGQRLAQDGDDATALKLYDELIRDYPKDLQVLALKGWLLQKLDRDEEADALFAELLRRGPRNVNIRLRLGALYEKQKRYDKAEAVLRELVALRPKDGEMHFELARLLLLNERFLEAHREFSKAAALARPGSQLLAKSRASQSVVIKRMIKKGRKHLDANENDQAEALFRQILEIDPDEAQAHYWLSQVFKHRKAYTKEVTALEKSLALAPNNTLLVPLLGQAYLDAGLPGKAVTLLEPMVAKHPFAFESRLLLAAAYEKRGEPARAEAQYDWLLGHETPEDIHRKAMERLGMEEGRKALKQGEYSVAREHFQRLLDVVPLDPEVNRLMAETFIRDENPGRALPYLQTALVSSPEETDLHFKVATLYERLGRDREAEAEYRLLTTMDIPLQAKQRAEKALDRILARRMDEKLEGLDLKAQSADALRSLVKEAEAMIAVGAVSGARKLAEAMLADRPQDVLGYRLLASVYRHEKRFDDALVLLKKALDIHPDDTVLLEDLAGAYEDAGRRGLAMDAYRKILRLDPSAVGPLMAMAMLYREQGDEEAMRRTYARVLSKAKDPRLRRQALSGLGMERFDALFEQGDSDGAGEIMQRLLDVAPDDPDVLLRQARLVRSRGQTEQAARLLQRLLSKAPGRLDARLELGEIYLDGNEPGRAIEEFERIARVGPGNPEARQAVRRLQKLYHERALAIRDRLQARPVGAIPGELRTQALALSRRFIGRGDFKDAELVLRTLISRARPSSEMFYWLAQVELKTHRQAQGLEDFRRSVSMAPDNVILLREFAAALELAGHTREAERAYDVVRKRDPDPRRRREADKRYGIVHGQRLALEGRLAEALAIYDSLLKDYPDDTQILGLRGWLLLELGREDEANGMFARLLKLAPDNARVRLRLAELYRKRGKTQEAERQWLAILERHPTGQAAMAALNGLGLGQAQSLVERKDWEGLEALYAGLLEKVPGNPVVLKLQAELYQRERRLPEFEATLRKVLEAAPDDADSLWGLANLYLRSRREEKAVPLLERLVEREQRSPRGKQALKMLSDIYRRQIGRLRDQKEYVKAARILKKFIRRNPDNVLARIQLGLLYVFGKEPDKAVEVLTEVTRLAPDQAQVYLQLATIHTQQRENRKAIEDYARYIAIQTDEKMVSEAVSELLLSLVRALLEENRQVAAIRVLEQMRDLGLRNKLIYGMLAFIQTRQGQTEQAIETYRQGIAIDGNDLLMRFNLGRLYERTNADLAALAQYRAILKRGKPGNRYVESARQRKRAVERRLRRFNSILSYRITGGRSVIEEQDLSNTGAVNTSFSSSLSYRLSSVFHPSKMSTVSVAAGLAHAMNHSGQNDSIAPSLTINGNLNLGKGFLNASASYRETYALLLDVFAGYGVNASLGGGIRFAHPLDALASLFSFDSDPFPESILYSEHPLPAKEPVPRSDEGLTRVDERRLRQTLVAHGFDAERLMSAVHRARLALRTGDAKAAMDDLSSLIEALPDDPDVNLLAGEAFRRLGDSDSAIESYWRVFDAAHDSPQARYFYGEVLRSQGFGDEAVDWYRAVIDSSAAPVGLKVRARRRLADIYRQQIESVLSKTGPEPGVDSVLARIDRLAALDEPRVLRDVVEQALKTFPDEPRLHLYLGRAWLNLGRADKALPGFETAKRLLGESPTLSRDLVTVYLRLGRLDEALGEYRWRLAHASSAEARYAARRALPVLAGGRPAGTVDAARDARIEKAVEGPWPEKGRASVEILDGRLSAIDEAFLAGKTELALRGYRRLLELTPDDALIELRVAEALQAMGRDADARKAIVGALAHDSRDIVHYRALALLGFFPAVRSLESGDYAEALDGLGRIHDALPDDAIVLLDMGLAEHRLGKDVRANAWFETVVENDPDNLTAHWLLGVFFNAKNQINRGMTELERVVADGKGTRVAERARALLDELEDKRLRSLVGEEVKEQEAVTKTLQVSMNYANFTPANVSIAETKTFGGNASLRIPSARWGSVSLGYGLNKAVNENPLGTDYANTAQSLSLSYNRPIPGVPRLFGGVSLSHQIVNYDNFDTNARVKLGRLAKRRIVRNSLSANLSYQLHENLTLSAGYSQSRSRSNLPVGLVYRPDGRPIAFQSLGLGDLSSKSVNVGLSFRF